MEAAHIAAGWVSGSLFWHSAAYRLWGEVLSYRCCLKGLEHRAIRVSVAFPNVDMFGACFVKQTFAICSGVVEGALNSLVFLALVRGAFCLAS